MSSLLMATHGEDVQGQAMLQHEEQRNQLPEQPAVSNDQKALATALWNLMNAQNEDLRERAELKLVLNVRYIATEVLLFIDGGEFNRNASSLFKRLGADDARVRAAAAMLDLAPERFVVSADDIVTRRDGEAELQPDELDVEVEELAPLITDAIQARANWACKIVLNYARMKAAFKDLLGSSRISPRS